MQEPPRFEWSLPSTFVTAISSSGGERRTLVAIGMVAVLLLALVSFNRQCEAQVNDDMTEVVVTACVWNMISVKDGDGNILFCINGPIPVGWVSLPWSAPVIGQPSGNPPTPCSVASVRAVQNTVIAKHEGYEPQLYLPRLNPGSPNSFVAPDGNTYSSTSGITVGIGVDLSWWTLPQINSWGITFTPSSNLWRAMASDTSPPTRGVTGQAAWNLLNSPVGTQMQQELTSNLLVELDNGAMSAVELAAAASFTKQTGSADFWYLPANTQTALVDIAYNYGSFGNSQLPANFLADLKAFNWTNLANDLNNSNVSRLTDDASLIKGDITNKSLPASGKCGP